MISYGDIETTHLCNVRIIRGSINFFLQHNKKNADKQIKLKLNTENLRLRWRTGHHRRSVSQSHGMVVGRHPQGHHHRGTHGQQRRLLLHAGNHGWTRRNAHVRRWNSHVRRLRRTDCERVLLDLSGLVCRGGCINQVLSLRFHPLLIVEFYLK